MRFHVGEIHHKWRSASGPDNSARRFTSPQSEGTRSEADPTLSHVHIHLSENPCCSSGNSEDWLEQHRATWGQSDRSSRGGNVPPGSAGEPRTGQRVTGVVVQV